MPDDLLPADAPEPTEASTEPTSEPEAPSDDAVYDEGASLLAEDKYDTGAEATTETEEEAPAEDDEPDDEEVIEEDEVQDRVDQGKTTLSRSEQDVLKRAQIPEDSWKNLSREAVDQLVRMQREMDRLQAEAGRQKAEPDKDEPKPKDTKADDDLDIGGVFDKLAESYDNEIRPLGELLTKIDQRSRPAIEAATRLPGVESLLTELVVDLAIDRVKADYPSATAPEARAKLKQRFWSEYTSGSYSPKDGEGILGLIHEAMSEAAKVQFSGVTETEAATTLVENSRKRVQAQPKTGQRKAPPAKPKSDDDVYDAVFAETMGR